MSRARTGGAGGLFLATFAVSSLVCLLLVASSRRSANEAARGAAAPANVPQVPAVSTPVAPAADPHAGHDHAGDDHAGHDHPKDQAQINPGENAPGFRLQESADKLHARTTQLSKAAALGQKTPPVDFSQGAAAGAGAGFVSEVNLDLGAKLTGASSVTPGSSFELEVSFGGDPGMGLSAYDMQLQWNPNDLTVTSIEGVKGGFSGPQSINIGNGQATWSAAEPGGAQAGASVPVARVICSAKDQVTDKVRLYFTPQSVRAIAPGTTEQKQIGGVSRAVTLPVK